MAEWKGQMDGWMDGWMKWGFSSFIFALQRLIRTARDHSNVSDLPLRIVFKHQHIAGVRKSVTLTKYGLLGRISKNGKDRWMDG
jgi:hypothetical protein